MPRERYQTRLDEDTAAWVDEYKQDRDITQAEAIRRLVRAGKDELEDDDVQDDDDQADDDPDPETVVADGSGVARGVLEDAANIYATIAIIPSALYTFRLVGAVDFAVFSMPQLWGASVTAALLFVVCVGALYSTVPERIDRALYSTTRTAREWAEVA